jgi:hypothetical protein
MPDKTARLLEYLAALAKLNTKTFFSLDEYESVFWLHSLPRESPLCFCRAWNAEENQDEIWLSVKKAPPQPPAPSPPDDCLLWLQQDALENFAAAPELEQAVLFEDTESDPESAEGRTLHLKEFPAVKEQWRGYLETEWRPWAEECRRNQAVRQAYTSLFFLYQELQKSGEQHELVLGLGLLRWKTASGREIRRH